MPWTRTMLRESGSVEVSKGDRRPHSLNGWVYRPVWLVDERQTDRVDGIAAYFHRVVVVVAVVLDAASLTRKTQNKAKTR